MNKSFFKKAYQTNEILRFNKFNFFKFKKN